MTSDIAISLENISKCYQIYDKPHDRLKQSIYPRLQKLFGRSLKTYHREFWALKDISFDVKKGETVGIIGRNGAGKSTLLQIICGTLTPTTGGIQVNGRVAALLELGAGFNPEFTGRENIYMNAGILGLSQTEIDSKYADIVAFADIGEFVDQPVKTYSSGMYVRLAFAVIAHVDADILIIDEALAVGDAIFTQKCMRYIRAFQSRGTLIFVSHDMSSVLNLCKSAVWLNNGTVQKSGASKDVADAYLQYTLQATYGDAAVLQTTESSEITSEVIAGESIEVVSILNYESKIAVTDNMPNATGWQTDVGKLLSIRIEKAKDGASGTFVGGEKVRVLITAKALQDINKPIIGFLVRDRLGQDLFGENTLPFTGNCFVPAYAGQEFSAEFVFYLPMLPNGDYAVMTSIADGDVHENIQLHYMHDALIFNVTSSKIRWGLVGVAFEKVQLKVSNDG
jgi:lipopolysaccharide transport system ATP-binding protein